MRHSAWMSTAGYYLGLAALVTLPVRAEGALAQSLLAVGAVYLAGSLTISVGYHRLFCHGAFRTSAFWHRAFALLGVAFLYGSPLQWAVTHATHHRRSDTEGDPHPRGWLALAFKGYRAVPLDRWRARRLLRQDPLHGIVDRHYVELYVAGLAVLAAVSPSFLLNAYLPALGLAHLVGGLHNLLSHHAGGPRNIALMEFLLPASGEWLHGSHHDRPGRASFRAAWWHPDLGAAFIRLIRTR